LGLLRRNHAGNFKEYNLNLTILVVLMKKLSLALFLAFASAPFAGHAAPTPAQFIWEPVPNVTSANIARTDWELITSDTINWPDGRIGLITYWRENKQRLMMRCVDFKNKDFQDTGALCSQPSVLKNK